MERRIRVGIALLVTLFCVALTTSMVLAAEKVTVTGTVAVSKDDAGAVTAVKVTSGDVTYSVTLDENGKKLADLAGKKVEVTGTVEVKDEVKWITVENSKAVETKE